MSIIRSKDIVFVISNVKIANSNGLFNCINATDNTGDRGPLYLDDSFVDVSDLIIENCTARFMIDFRVSNYSLVRSILRNNKGIANDRALITDDSSRLRFNEFERK